MIYLHLDQFEGLLCGCNDFAYIREVNTSTDEITDFCDYCCVKAFGMLAGQYEVCKTVDSFELV